MVGACKTTVKMLSFCDTFGKSQPVTSYFGNSTIGNLLKKPFTSVAAVKSFEMFENFQEQTRGGMHLFCLRNCWLLITH